MQMRSVLRTGWGPRGDSGSARGRVRATQPAFFFASRYITGNYAGVEGLDRALLLSPWASALHPKISRVR